MEEKKKFKITANKKVLTFSLIALALLVLVSTSYAYFSAVITGNDTAKQVKVTTGTMALKLHGNTEVGITNALPGNSTTITFSVENTGNDTTYVLKMDQVTNTFVDKNDLVYVLKKGDTVIKEETVLPSPISGTTVLLPVVEIAAGATDNYTMIITFKETGDNQNDNQGKEFGGKIQIGEATDKMLAVNLINNSNLKTTTPDFSTYPDEANTGLFKAEDDEGTSYYFRGNIENNYVDLGDTYTEDKGVYVLGINGTRDFDSTYDTYDKAVKGCGDQVEENYIFVGYKSQEACIADIQDYSIHAGDKKLWRVVRINGDGSIRLISDDTVGSSVFNTTRELKGAGYTYDNSAPNVQDGTSSTIKTYLDNWYTTNITNKGLDGIVATSTYCNDTSISSVSGDQNNYGTHERLANNTPQLTCNETLQTYGGKYALKVGLLSADELMMAGYTNSTSANQKTYIWHPYWFWTGSPDYYNFSRFSVFEGYVGKFDSENYADLANGVRPVINLKANSLISSGNGTKDKPYVLSA